MTSDIYEKNIDVIKGRWPNIYQSLADVDCSGFEVVEREGLERTLMVNGIHLSSCFDRESEAHVQATLLPETAQSVWLYGVTTGDLQNLLLRRVTVERIEVVVLSLGLLKLSLDYFDHANWLSDKRVVLSIATPETDIRSSFCVVPACLRIVDAETFRLRDLIVLELETEHVNAKVRGNKKFINQIRQNIDLVEQDNDVADLFGTKNSGMFYIAAAGPTLSENYQRLISRKKGELLIAVDAAVKPLLANNVYPDIVVTIDGERDPVLAMLDVDLQSLSDTPLVYFPIAHRDVLLHWPGPRYVAYSNSPLYEDLLFKHPKELLYSSGTVLHVAVDVAVKMGAGKVCLMGADFSFPNDQTHVSNAVYCQPVEHQVNQEWLVNGSGEQVRTSKNLRGYLCDLERYITKHKQVEFHNMSRSGAFIVGAKYDDME